MAEPPTGAVTFLFTDIEGSTRLVKQLRDRYGAVLAEHRDLLRAAFEAHGGYEVDTQGDSFFVAFSSARDAVLAAVEGQLALMSHDWPEGIEIKVRMGLHTGQAVAADRRYTGLAVHRAARIGAAGHGGQILVSQATQTLLEDEEEDLHVFLRDLGEQRLKDLDRPVRLYQAAASGLPETFPPVRGAAAPEDEAAPVWRRRPVLAGAAVGFLLLAVLAAALVLSSSGGGGLEAIQPNHLGAIDLQSGEILAEVPVGIEPGPVAVGAGSVWVGNLQDRTLTKVDPAARSVMGTIPLENRTPTGIAVGLGSVWVAHGILGEVSLLDPEFGRVADTVKVGGRAAFGAPYGSLSLDAGSAWVAFGDSTLARLDAGGDALGQTLAGNQPAGIVAAAGSVWVANAGDATVERFDQDSFREGPLRPFSVGQRPIGIVHAFDAVWVACSGDDIVTRIDPDSGSTLQIPVGDEPTALAAATNGVWVANVGARSVSRIDPQTNKVVETVDVVNVPAGLAAAGDVLWVAARAP